MNAFAQLRCSSKKNAATHGPIANRKPSIMDAVRNQGCLFTAKAKVRNRIFAHGLGGTENIIGAVEEWTLPEHLLSNGIVVRHVGLPTRKLATLVCENTIRAEKYVELGDDSQARSLGRENTRG